MTLMKLPGVSCRGSWLEVEGQCRRSGQSQAVCEESWAIGLRIVGSLVAEIAVAAGIVVVAGIAVAAGIVAVVGTVVAVAADKRVAAVVVIVDKLEMTEGAAVVAVGILGVVGNQVVVAAVDN